MRVMEIIVFGFDLRERIEASSQFIETSGFFKQASFFHDLAAKYAMQPSGADLPAAFAT